MKKGKIKAGFKAILPFIYSLIIQVIGGVVFGQVFTGAYSKEWVTDNMALILMLVHLSMVIIFGFWYFNICMEERESRLKEIISLKSIGTVVLLAFGFQFITRGALIVLNMISSETMAEYNEMMQNVGIGEYSVVSILAVVILAPIGEECIFRGVTVRLLEKTGLKYWIINIIQALLFGIMHGNLIQGVYAFFLGLILGAIVYKYKSIYMSILGHLVYNFIGITAGFLGDSTVIYIILILLAIICSVLGVVLLIKEETRERAVNNKKYSLSYYKAFTPKLYRVLVHIVFPVIILVLGVLVISQKEYIAVFTTSIASLLMLVEFFGDFCAFGSSSNKEAAPINWLKSSYNGRTLMKDSYLWDIGIRLVKFTVMWGLMGLCPILTGNAAFIAIAYLSAASVTFFAVNIIRRIENAQMTVLVTMPSVGLAGVMINYLPKLTAFQIPVIIFLIILFICSIVVTYKFAMGAFENSYHDAV